MKKPLRKIDSHVQLEQNGEHNALEKYRTQRTGDMMHVIQNELQDDPQKATEFMRDFSNAQSVETIAQLLKPYCG